MFEKSVAILDGQIDGWVDGQINRNTKLNCSFILVAWDWCIPLQWVYATDYSCSAFELMQACLY